MSATQSGPSITQKLSHRSVLAPLVIGLAMMAGTIIWSEVGNSLEWTTVWGLVSTFFLIAAVAAYKKL